ncbi:serine/threonine protein phosphatase [Filimonas lacunae]|nr:serine/threonine protein phosphatase [Filimonas lacunae]
MWKAIGKSVTGSLHVQAGKGCEDAIHYSIDNHSAALICFVSDGAGSATQAAIASKLATQTAHDFIVHQLQQHQPVTEPDIYQLAESVFDALQQHAAHSKTSLAEYACTLLGCIIFAEYACFIQVGDGAIVKNTGNDFYAPVWWPHNGEYQNTTFFINENGHPHLKVLVTEEVINEVAIFTDGLQMLTLNYESNTAHHPFFKDMFKWLRIAHHPDQVGSLNQKLEEYLSSATINNLTNDDKTLFLATRLQQSV